MQSQSHDANGSPVDEVITNAEDIRSTTARLRALAGMCGTNAEQQPRERALYVRDDHVAELLAGIGDLILARRRMGFEPGLPALEMQSVLTTMLSQS